MWTLKKWLRIAFGFSRTESHGFLILLPLIVLILFSEPLYSWYVSRRKVDLDKERIVLDSLVACWAVHDSLQHRIADSARLAALPAARPFDPNTASAPELIALGFPEKIARHIVAYRSKGGKFRVKTDLKKIYGLELPLYNRLSPLMRLPDSIRRPPPKPFTPAWPAKPPAVAFDLNGADTTQLIAIYGIGSRLSRRIVAYREKLGGFMTLDQLHEVYGLDSATIDRLVKRTYIRPGYNPRKLNINLATDRELSAHPYISMVIAKAIVAYRFQHGNFAAVEELRGLQIVKREEADKIIPYLSVNP